LDVRIKEAHQHLFKSIHTLYESREAKSITDWVIEDLTGMSRSGMLIHQDDELKEDQEKKLHQYTSELLHGRPVQYVLSNAWFMGMPFFVDERVLIPRPETEEMVELVKGIYNHSLETKEKLLLADIGTGSGCIAIALKKNYPAFEVWGIDNSEGALEVATINAKKQNAYLTLEKNNILDNTDDDGLPVFDIIISNPPYIPLKDKVEMDSVVLDHEPHIALFVDNEDPLKFYKAILTFSNYHLKRGGMIFFETHADFAKDVVCLMEQFDFENVEIKKDMYGKDRIVFGRKSGASL
jgi:release factor glutamine methyltransferase